MKYVEDEEEDVELMSVEEELEHLASNARESCCPHEQSSKQRYFSCQIGFSNFLPCQHLEAWLAYKITK